MSISTVTNRREYQADGTSAVFNFQYEFFQQSDLGVFVYNSSVVLGGIITPKVLNTDYVISGTTNNSGIYPNGANIIFNSSPNAQAVVVIFRSSVITNSFNVGQNGTIPSTALNNELDYLTLISQRLQDQITRAVRLADGFFGTFDSSLPANLKTSAGKRLIVNSSANGWTFDETLGQYIQNTVVIATTNSSITSLGGATSGLFLQSQGSSAPTWGTPSLATLTGILPTANGGTGTGSSFTRGQLVFAGSSGIFDRSAGMSWDENGVLTVGSSFAGAQVFTPGTLRSAALSAAPVRSDATGLLSVGSTSLTAEVSGILPTGRGGTNNSSFTQYGVVYAPQSNQLATVPSAASGLVLTSAGSSAPSFQPVSVTNSIVTKTADYTTTNADNKIIAASSLFNIFLYKPSAGDTGKEIEVLKNTTQLDFNRVVIQGSNCTITRTSGVVNSTAVHTLMERVKFFNDGANWFESERHASFAEINLGSSTVTSSGGGALKGSSIVSDNFWGAREGNVLHFRYEFRSSNPASGGAAGTGDYQVLIPQGLLMDTTKIITNSGVWGSGANVIPQYSILATGANPAAGVMAPQVAYPLSASQFKIFVPSNGVWSGGYASIIATNTSINVMGRMSIQEWNA